MATYFGNEDLAALLEGTGGVDLTFGPATVKALRDEEGEDVLDSGAPSPVIGRQIVFTVAADSLPGLAEGSTVTSEAVTYEVRGIRPYGDGALLRLFCGVAT